MWSPATSYAEMEEVQAAREAKMEAEELISYFPMLARNAIESEEIEDKAAAVETIASELADRLRKIEGEEYDEDKAISEREDVSEAERKRAVAEYGKVTYADPKNKKYPIDTPAHIRAAWSYINMPRNARKYSSSEVAAIKRRIVSAWKSQIDSKGPPQAKKGLLETLKEKIGLNPANTGETSPDGRMFMAFKDKNDQWSWIARYSNNFRDRDNPPEIISDKSHRRFVELVEKGLAPYPELWLWHVKDWKVGRATWIAYDDAGFAMAAGVFNPGCEQVAEWLSKQTDFAVSHGMPTQFIMRDYEDPSVIVGHVTREISPLPASFAANELTQFYAFKEEPTMAIPQEKKKTLVDMFGLPEDVLAKIEATNQEDASKAAESGIESKEKTDAQPPAETTETKVDTATPVEPGDAKPEVESPEDAAPSRKEVAEAITALVVPYMKKLDGLIDTVGKLEKQLESVKGQAETLQGTLVKDSSQASLMSMLLGSAVGDPANKVSDSDALANQKPKETVPAVEQRTGIPFIDQMLSQAQ
jgi:hypothetical protein